MYRQSVTCCSNTLLEFIYLFKKRGSTQKIKISAVVDANVSLPFLFFCSNIDAELQDINKLSHTYFSVLSAIFFDMRICSIRLGPKKIVNKVPP